MRGWEEERVLGGGRGRGCKGEVGRNKENGVLIILLAPWTGLELPQRLGVSAEQTDFVRDSIKLWIPTLRLWGAEMRTPAFEDRDFFFFFNLVSHM